MPGCGGGGTARLDPRETGEGAELGEEGGGGPEEAGGEKGGAAGGGGKEERRGEALRSRAAEGGREGEKEEAVERARLRGPKVGRWRSTGSRLTAAAAPPGRSW